MRLASEQRWRREREAPNNVFDRTEGRTAKMQRRPMQFGAFFAVCAALGGCVESRFELAPDSRLPSWISLPSGTARADFSATLTHYTVGESRIDVVDRQGHTVASVSGESCWHPVMKEKKNKYGGFDPDSYPHFSYITANGIREVIEHRKMEPVFRISDDPKLRKAALEADHC